MKKKDNPIKMQKEKVGKKMKVWFKEGSKTFAKLV